MKKFIVLLVATWMVAGLQAQVEPLFSETFDRCIDAEDENYGYTGGNDEQWGGDIAKAQVIYTDNKNEWDFTYCNGAYQCLKVGTSSKQGAASTPVIVCTGEAVLSFRVAPWEGDSLFYISISGGTTTDPTAYELAKHKWTDITVRISDIKGSLKITFSSPYKHRFFLDDVVVTPADPNAGAIRTDVGSMLDFGLVGKNYNSQQRTINVTGANLSGTISATIENDADNLFRVSASSLPAAGGALTVTCVSDGSADMHGAFLMLRGKDAKTQEQVEKRVTLLVEVATVSLEGSGTKPDPFTVNDVHTIADYSLAWSGTYYWCTGYILGGVKRYQDQFDGISYTDTLSLVLATTPDETDMDKIVTVQISHDARMALNVKDHPELIGKRVKVQGLLVNDKGNPLYLGKDGIRNVSTESQYEIEGDESSIEVVKQAVRGTKVLREGVLYIERDGCIYTITGERVKE
ncbi:MAG: DUF6359 domain-containing protein [Bacteroidales bacterium]|nr:DUF6359 domain-containing protein [Bacteroidales bacterium]MDY6406520.1 DUF6359 domain-containing protein [Bacteroidales bacterium]